MKYLNLLLAMLVLFIPNTYANKNTDVTAQIKFVQKIYADALNEDLMGIDIIKLHASPVLRQLIIKRDQIAQRHIGEMCEWVRSVLIPGNDYDVKANKIKYTALIDNRIRVQGTNFGEKFQLDIEVKCEKNVCKIMDIYDPKSYKTELSTIVKKGTC